jgi:hypothetical protein
MLQSMTHIACSLTQDDRLTRRERWLTVGARALVQIVPTEAGLALVFATEPGVETELRELAELERNCCAFATWTVSADEERVVLDVAADGDAVAVIQGMFGRLKDLPRGVERR